MKSLWNLLTLLLLLLAPFSTSLARSHRDAGPGGSGHPEIKAYVAQNVLPVVRQQRQKLEPQLSTADKAQLAIYRTQLQELRQRGQTLRQSIRPADTVSETRPELTEAQKQQFEQLRADRKALLLNVAQLAQKYQGDIARLAQEIQPQKEKWATDLKALAAKNAAPEPEEPGRLHKRGHHRGVTDRFFRPNMFLLLDPSTPTEVERELGGTSVFPNPVLTTSQLEYEVKKAGPVTVELLDGRGNALRTVAQEAKQEKGQHTVQINLADLPTGTYYYKITTRSGYETRRFVKE